MNIYNNIINCNTSIEKIEEDQKQFKSNLNEITKENPKYKSKAQLNTIEYVKNLYNSREEVLKLFNDYDKIRSESKYKAKHGTGLKILTPEQMLQRLPIAFAQVKADDNSKNNNIIKSMQIKV